jgi:hypothetical protein
LLAGSGFRGGASPALAVPGHPASILGGARSGRKLVTRLTYLGACLGMALRRTMVTAASPCSLGGAPTRGRSVHGAGLPATTSTSRARGDWGGAYRGMNRVVRLCSDAGVDVSGGIQAEVGRFSWRGRCRDAPGLWVAGIGPGSSCGGG